MNDPVVCSNVSEPINIDDVIHCDICSKKLDMLTSQASMDINDSIYICFESIKQKIFVYGKYKGGKYGATGISRYFTKEECSKKVCDEEIKKILLKNKEDEYSRMITCKRGNMDALILTRQMINFRKSDLLGNSLPDLFKTPAKGKKYYCYQHALENNFICQCGEELIKIGSEKHRDLLGMEDQLFIETYLPEILELK